MNSQLNLTSVSKWPVLVLAFGFGLWLSGCITFDQIAVFPDFGKYTHQETIAEDGSTSISEISVIELNRAQLLGTFIFRDGSQITVTLSKREFESWPTGCPTNINSTKMQILDIDQAPLTIGEFIFAKPVLVKDCPRSSEHIVLRNDGQISGGTACVGASKCLIFDLDSSKSGSMRAPLQSAKTLPRSAKGYELYSWFERSGMSWHYTLVTGTNRLKSSEEITKGDSVVLTDGWVKLTFAGSDALLDTLERLPAGEYVYWRGESWLIDRETSSQNMIFPAANEIQVINQYCEDHDLNLYLTP